jgi:hypothetical protein
MLAMYLSDLAIRKYKNEQRAKNSKIRQSRVMFFFCNALRFNEIYLSKKFRDDISYIFPGKIESVKMNKGQ